MKQAIKDRIGHKVKSSGSGPEPYFAYIPRPLPPNPPLQLDRLQGLLEKASQAIEYLAYLHLQLQHLCTNWKK